jgi:hypothetical protein
MKAYGTYCGILGISLIIWVLVGSLISMGAVLAHLSTGTDASEALLVGGGITGSAFAGLLTLTVMTLIVFGVASVVEAVKEYKSDTAK